MFNNKPKLLITDCDGCLVNWIELFERFMEAKGYEKLPDSDAEYNIGKRYSVDFDTHRRLVREFNESDKLLDLPALNGSNEFVKKLHKDHGFEFIVVTSVGTKEITHSNRSKNLNDHFGNAIKEVVCLDVGEKKYDTLCRWKNTGLFWIEDHIEQAMCGSDAGLRPLLMTDITNAHRQNNNLERVSDWEEVYKLVCKSYGLKA